MTPLVRLALAMAVALAALACGRAPRPEPSPDAPPTTPTTPTTTAAAGIGQISEVQSQRVTVGDNRVGSGHPLRSGDVVSTNDKGIAAFSIRRAFDDCQIRESSRVRVSGGERPLDVELGSILCTVGEKEALFTAGDHQIVAQQKSLVGVTVGPGGEARVDVLRGFIEVRPSVGSTRFLGPALRLTLPKDEPPAEPTFVDRARLHPTDRAAFDRMAPRLEPTVRLPDPAGSPALRRVAGSKVLKVAIDAPADTSVERFTSGLFRWLGGRWGVRVETSVAGAGGLPGPAVSAADVVGSRRPLPGLTSIPFLRHDGESWFLLVKAGDPRFESALREALSAFVYTGDYAREHRAAFEARPPVYEPVRPILVPPRVANPSE